MSEYRVLARKYRPQTFADLIGQDVLVRTLTNAFSSGRIAHAFLLTGIRGIGKTTTARIIARGLNCIGPDGTNTDPTTDPCGVCPNCVMIREDRHVDVIEMDAASRTGIDDIRDIIETIHYAPTSARTKVYIIDEVHMLSKQAFNGLLKTLEEPPPNVVFIFATTELRKIPITIISRCQRFDLKRIDTEMLVAHLTNIASKENIVLSPECATLIATAAEGSVRDSLSLLDQAIAMSSTGEGTISIESARLRDMLGLADKTQSFALLEHVFAGRSAEAAEQLHALYRNGVDPAMLLSDLLDIVHYLTRIHVAPKLATTIHYSPGEQEAAQAMVAKLDMPSLARAWQMLLKGVDELKSAPNLLPALEMVLVRLTYTANLPSPADAVRRMEQGGYSSGTGPSAAASSSGGGTTNAVGTASMASTHMPAPTTTMHRGNLALAVRHDVQPMAQTQVEALARPETFEEIIALLDKKREPILSSHLVHDVGLVAFAMGRIDLYPIRHLPADFAPRVNRRLKEWTGDTWNIVLSDTPGAPSLGEQRAAAKQKARDYAASHARVQEVLRAFPGAEVIEFEPNKNKD